MIICSPRWLFILFFISGAAGLIYEVVWTRALVLVFGSTTNTIVAVIAAFLGGLAIGSLLFGRFADRKEPSSLLRIYAYLEGGVALSALLSLPLFKLLVPFYKTFSDGSEVTTELLFVKFLFAIGILLIPTILMGGTLPVLVNIVQSFRKHLEKNVSILYAVNTFGATAGTLAAGFILLEIIGLWGTLFAAAGLNALAAIVAITATLDGAFFSVNREEQLSNTVVQPTSIKAFTVLFALGVSGFIAIAYQVLWTRMLTPYTGTFIYALAAILAIYLFGIAFGSLFYHFFLAHHEKRNVFFALTQIGIGVFALISVFMIHVSLPFSRHIIPFLMLLPATICMGISLPAAIALLKKDRQSGTIVGLSYFSNTIGTIGGGFAASFFLIPFWGSSRGAVLLASVNFVLALGLLLLEMTSIARKRFIAAIGVVGMLFGFSSGFFFFGREVFYDAATKQRIDRLRSVGAMFDFREDEAGSVFAYKDPSNNIEELLVNSIPTTLKAVETKLMAHIPVALHADPHDMLVIAFGMGTTFRSALLHGLTTDVVELSPSVPEMFPFFYSNATELRANPLGRVIINDGRNYVALTHKRYDIVTIDPPPPFNAAGTTVLYAKEFYKEISRILRPGGLVMQWIFFGSREDDIAMAMRSFSDVFPYTRVFLAPSPSIEGVFLVGSFNPIEIQHERFSDVFSASFVKKDLKEEDGVMSGEDVLALLVADERALKKFADPFPPVTDNRPRTEYFFLRHLLYDAPRILKQRLLLKF